ncbi:MAG: multicopper oxidase domain-containing protein [Methylococcaceae bacterium]|nr:multicopper oxidase domain-containing protein [Methylococcaceae bacterium]
MKQNLSRDGEIITARGKTAPMNFMARLSPISFAVGCALFLGAAQTASAATTFTLTLAPPGPIGAAINTAVNYTATLTETGTTASKGSTLLKMTLPVGMTFVSGGAGTTGFTCALPVGAAVTCTRTTSILRNTPVIIPIVLNTGATVGTKAVSANVSGGGAAGVVTSNAVSTVVSALAPAAFTATLAGPANGLVGVPFTYTTTITNTGATATVGSTLVKTTLPAGLTFKPVVPAVAGQVPCAAVAQAVTCTIATPIAAAASVPVIIDVTPTTVGAKATTVNVSGGGSFGVVTSTAVSTAVILPPDLSVTVAQPAPALKVSAVAPVTGAMSQVPVRVSNIGGSVINAPINVQFTLPPNVTAPAKFSRVADHWVCVTTGQIISCNYDLPLAIGMATNLRIPVTPSVAGALTAFKAVVAAPVGTTEVNIANNTATLVPTAVATYAYPAPGLSTQLNVLYSGAGAKGLLPITRNFPKFALPLPNAFASFFKHTPDTTTVPGVDLYNLDIKQIKAQALPPGYPATDVFAYGDPARPDTFTYPAHTIDARSMDPTVNALGLGREVRVQYNNTMAAATHLLPIDHTIHGANAGEPDIRSVGHLHGAKIINQTDDGYPEAWHSPNGTNGMPHTTLNNAVPINYNPAPFVYTNLQDSTLLWYHDHTMGLTRLNVYAGLAGLYRLRDDNEMAMINNNQLPSGPYELPLVLQDRMFHVDGSFAYPDIFNGAAVAAAAAVPATQTVPGTPATPAIPAFVAGSAASPSMVPEFFGDVMMVNGVAWPYLQVEPRKYRFRLLNGSNARFFELGLKYNGRTAAGARAIYEVPVQVIGTEGGFLNTPIPATVGAPTVAPVLAAGVWPKPALTIAPAERYDIIVDFTGLAGQNITLTNTAKAPYGGPNGGGLGAPVTPGLHDQVMQFRVNLPLSTAPVVATTPAVLRTNPILTLPTPTTGEVVHQVLLGETVDEFGRILPALGTPTAGFLSWMGETLPRPAAPLLPIFDPQLAITEKPFNGSVETWELYNTSVDAHPVHLHDGAFQVVNRQDFNALLLDNGKLANICFTNVLQDTPTEAHPAPFPCPTIVPTVVAGAVPPTPTTVATPVINASLMEGFISLGAGGMKETVIANPSPFANPLAAPNLNLAGVNMGTVVTGSVTRVRMKFENAGQYVWHCHILEHEDHDMMRPMLVQ